MNRKYNNDKYAGIVNRGRQCKYQFLGRKQRQEIGLEEILQVYGWTRPRPKEARTNYRGGKASLRTLQCTCKETKHATNSRHRLELYVKIISMKTVEYRTMQVQSQNSSRLVHPVKWLYPPFQSAPTMAPSAHMYGIRVGKLRGNIVAHKVPALLWMS